MQIPPMDSNSIEQELECLAKELGGLDIQENGGMMANPSPSVGARQTPGGGGGPAGPQGGGMMGTQGMGGSSGMSAMPMDERVLNHEIMNIPLMSLNSIRHELGYGAKELGALDIQEKVDIRISSHFVLQSWLYLSLGFPPFFCCLQTWWM